MISLNEFSRQIGRHPTTVRRAAVLLGIKYTLDRAPSGQRVMVLTPAQAKQLRERFTSKLK